MIDRLGQKISVSGREGYSYQVSFIESSNLFLSLFEMSKGVVGKIEKLLRIFLWRDKYMKRKVHLVAWSDVLKPKSKGGLEIVPIQLRNHALLCKWGWRFGGEREALWVRILKARYNVADNSSLVLGDKVETNGSTIVKAWWKLS